MFCLFGCLFEARGFTKYKVIHRQKINIYKWVKEEKKQHLSLHCLHRLQLVFFGNWFMTDFCGHIYCAQRATSPLVDIQAVVSNMHVVGILEYAWDTVSKGICIRCIKLSDHKNKFCHLLYAKTLYLMHTLFGKRWRANWVFWVNLIKKPSWSSEPPMEFEQCFWSTRQSCWRY